MNTDLVTDLRSAQATAAHQPTDYAARRAVESGTLTPRAPEPVRPAVAPDGQGRRLDRSV